ncbi:hypothetical protein V4F39_20410 [Aquincola sp. MAHUQ-54]|uniref:Uncharacterized protein n=1 Tax=Aquincola agrisoli TaxID=3119538 RepID=A0AAW9QKZ8_9BURK
MSTLLPPPGLWLADEAVAHAYVLPSHTAPLVFPGRMAQWLAEARQAGATRPCT